MGREMDREDMLAKALYTFISPPLYRRILHKVLGKTALDDLVSDIINVMKKYHLIVLEDNDVIAYYYYCEKSKKFFTRDKEFSEKEFKKVLIEVFKKYSKEDVINALNQTLLHGEGYILLPYRPYHPFHNLVASAYTAVALLACASQDEIE